VCPLLANLVGPGTLWTDVLFPSEPRGTNRRESGNGLVAPLRIDLVLANHDAMRRAHAAELVAGGWQSGHHPVFVDLTGVTPGG